MLIQLLYACDYLLVVLLLLPGSNQRSLNVDHLQRKNETAEENAKSISLLKEVDNFVDGQCPPSTDNLKLNGMDGNCGQDECRSDVDCIEDSRCCEDGCSFKCMEPWFPNRVVDWTKSPSLNQMPDGLELPDQNNEPWKSGGEPCSTSVLDGLQPLRCPTNHVCQIIMDGDIQLNIPNRGECVKINDKKSASEIMNNANNQDFLTIDAVCSDKEETYKHKEKFRKDCNICVCHNGVVFCDNQPCPLQIGIPASITNYEEQRHSSQFISIDSEKEEDKEDASGSSGSSKDAEGDGEARVAYEGDIELGANAEEEHNEEQSGNGDSAQEADVSSGDGDEEHLGEVNGRDDGESGDDVIDLESQGNVNNQEFGAESGSAELETKAPGTTEPDTTTKTTKPKISTSAKETSTLSPEISTFTRETTTLSPKSSTLLPEISTFTRETTTLAQKSSTLSPEIPTLVTEVSTASPGVEEYETTESSKLVKIAPTEDIIRLEKWDYEPSGISLEKYSGDDEEGTEGSTGEYGSDDHSGDERSTEETQHPQPVYPDTIVLDRSQSEAEFGFETDGARTDVVAGSQNSETEVRTGDDGSASGSIVGKNDVKNTKRRSETLEYLETTDDEN